MAAETSGRAGPRPAPGYWLAVDGHWYPADMHPDPAKRLVLMDEAAVMPAPAAGPGPGPDESAVGDPVGIGLDGGRPRRRSRRTAGLPLWAWAAAVLVVLVAGGLLVAVRRGDSGEVAADDVSSATPTRATSTATAPVATSATTAPSGAAGRADLRPPAAAPAPTALPTPGSSQDHPLALGQSATLRDADSGDIDILVDRLIPDAAADILAANSFNAPPPAGTRYVMVHVRATYHAGLKRRGLEALLLDVDWTVVGPGGRQHPAGEVAVLPPDGLETFTSIPDGASLAGNLVFTVEPGSPIYLRVSEAFCLASCDEAWFTLA